MKSLLRILIIIITLFFVLTACSNSGNVQNKNNFTNSFKVAVEDKNLSTQENYYLSLTASFVENEKLYDSFAVFNPTTGSTDEVYKLEATSQYALGVVDKIKNILYFVKRTTTNKKEVDQIFSVDLNTKKVEQITTTVEAINNLILVNNKLFFVASRFGNFNLEFGYFDTKSKQTWFSDQFDYTDIMFESLSYNKKNNRLYAATYSLLEDKQRREDFYSKQEKDSKAYYKRPKRTLYEFDTNGIITRKLGTFDEKEISSFVVSNNGKSAILGCINSKDENRQILMIEDISKLDSYRRVTDLESVNARNLYFSSQDKGIYYCSTKDTNGGNYASNWLMYYDLDTKKSKKIYMLKNGFISNFTVIQ